MGFGSFKKKFKKYTGVDFDRAALATVTLGASEIHTLGQGDKVIDFIKDPTGAKAAAKDRIAALRAAGKIEEAHRLEVKAREAEIIAETAPFREQGQLELERLRGQTPGSTEFYKQSLERGAESIAEQRSRFGLVSSGGTGEQIGGLTSDLLLQEELARQQGIGRAAELSQTGYGASLEALRQAGGATYRQAQTTANIGTAKAQSKLANRNFYTNLATQAGGAAAGYFLGGPPGAAASGGASAPAQGGYAPGTYNLQPSQYNQFKRQY